MLSEDYLIVIIYKCIGVTTRNYKIFLPKFNFHSSLNQSLKRKSMKKRKTNNYFISILLVQILLLLFKIDKDIFSFQEFIQPPHQTYTEQLYTEGNFKYNKDHSENLTSLDIGRSESLKQKVIIWQYHLLSYNFLIKHFLNNYKITLSFLSRIIRIIHKNNISHMSSEDEIINIRYI